MQLPQSKTRQTYIERIKVIEKELKDATSGDQDKEHLAKVQNQLDTLAEKYQFNEEIGKARYKLYELQALVHYFNGNDEEALDFINQAIEMRGDDYARAEKLKAQLLSKSHNQEPTTSSKNMTKQQRRKKLVGLEGWLALFVVGVGLSILLGIINLSGYGSTFSELSTLSAEVSNYVNAITPVLWFEILSNIFVIGLAIWLIVLLAKHKKQAKTVAIIFLVSSAVLSIIDYAWAMSVFDTFNVTQYVQSELSKASGNTGRAVLVAFIWVPYFLVSKRVKATLTE